MAKRKPTAADKLSDLEALALAREARALHKQGKRSRAADRQAFLTRSAGDWSSASQTAAWQARRAWPSDAPARVGMRAPPNVADDALWLPLGPSFVLEGQAGGRPRVAGRIRDVWVSPNGQRVYAGSANGGVWYSRDAGESWDPLGGWTMLASAARVDKPSSALACGCLFVHFDPGNDPALDEVWVGTGELTPIVRGRPFSRTSGIGVLRATGPATAALYTSRWTAEGSSLAGKGIYRIACEPPAPPPPVPPPPTHFVAATSGGLWERTSASAPDWNQVAVAPFAGVAGARLVCTDVLWLRRADGSTRLFVAVSNATAASPGLYVSSNGLAGPFTPIALANLAQTDSNGNHAPSRLSLAVAPNNPEVVYVLGSGALVWRLDSGVPTPLQGIPPNLLGGQDSYNQAIAVHPTQPNRLVLGGATEFADGQFSASLYLSDVTVPAPGTYRYGFLNANVANPANDNTFIGNGVHADVHVARFVTVAGVNQLWIGCDGGVFRSLEGNQAQPQRIKNTFIARNSGLATLECGYVATHPQVDGHVMTGAQDNGALERIGVNLWRRPFAHGDAGAVLYQTTAPHRRLVQVHNGHWHNNAPLSWSPIDRSNDINFARTAIETAELAEAAFYSGADVIASGAAETRLALGTTRVWFSRDWGVNWATLPSLVSDPLAIGSQNGNTDACVLQSDGVTRDNVRGQVLACRWATDTRLLVLCQKEVLVHKLVADVTVPGGLRCTRHVITRHGTRKSEDVQTPVQVASPGQRLPEIGQWSDIASHLSNRGDHGSCYVSGTGDSTRPDMDTVWWFDGTDRWHATRLRTHSDAARRLDAPVYAVIVDPSQPHHVYAGTAVGVWRGVLNLSGPTWEWSPVCNGLPEAAVQDMSIHVNPRTGERLLRAAIQARGIWEVSLSQARVPAISFVRVHAWDTRREPTTSLLNPNSAVTALTWAASPDIRIHPRRGSRPPAFQRISAANPTLLANNYLHWVFQTALHATDPLVRPTGVRTPQFEARLRAANANSTRITRTVWNTIVGTSSSSPNAFAPPWNAASPSEADLYELIVDRPVTAPNPCAQLMTAQRCQVHVQVHHRHTTPVPAAQARVTLLRRTVTGVANIGAALPVAWVAAVQAAVRAAATPSPLPVLADGWTFADEAAALAVRSPAADVDVRLSRTVSFDVDLRGLAAGDRVMLVAVVHTDADPATLPAAANLQALILGCRFVAARCVEIG